MRPLAELLGELRRTGTRVWVEGSDLRYAAPAGSLSAELLAELRRRKADLLALLRPDADPHPLGPAPPDASLELSPAQQRLWVLDRLHGADPVYTISLALRLRGPLDVPVLRRSLATILRRHEVLRTGYAPDGEVVRPIVAPGGDLPWAETDLRDHPSETRLVEACRQICEQASRAFDLRTPPLVRFALWRLLETDHILLMALHHIAADARSIEIISEELGALYGAELEGRAAALPDLPIRYADFAWHQRRQLGRLDADRQLAYWRHRLADMPPLLELPADRPRPAAFSSAGEAIAQPLQPELVDRLRALARRSGTTLYVTLVTAVAALLARITGRDDIPIACPATHRTRPELDRLVGFFVNTLVLRLDLSGDPPFAAALRRARTVVAEAFAHQDVPFDAVLQSLQAKRSLGHAPLAQVSVALLDADRARPHLHGLTTEPFDFGSSIARYDLALEVYGAGDGLTVYWIFSSALFDAPTVRRMADIFLVLLDAIAADPERLLADLPLLEAEEQRRVTQDWAGAGCASPPPATPVHALFERQAAATPDAVALELDDRIMSFGELNARANRLARRLVEAGVGPDVPVGLWCERSFELVIGLLAVLKAGGAFVPLDPALPRARLSFMVADCGCRLILSDGATPLGGAEDVPLVDLTAEPDDSSVDRDRDPQRATAGTELAYVIYTSGSTGRPKGCQIEHRSLANYLAWADESYRVEGGGSFGLFTSLGFDLTVTSLFLPLVRGRTLRIFPERDALDAVLRDYLGAGSRLDSIKLTPAHIALLPELELASTRVQVAVVGGEQLLPEQVDALRRLNPAMRIYNEYGPTEATVGCVVKELVPGEERVLIGRPISNAQVYVLDRHLRPQPVGVPGELFIGGLGLARGYVNRPDLTAERFVEIRLPHAAATRVYRTGDGARWLPSGELECLGRTDAQVKIRGFRVEPGEIEAVLASYPGVRQAAVLAAQDGPHRRRLVAHVAALPSLSTIALRGFLGERVPDYMVPAAFVMHDGLPLNANGKVDRDVLARFAPSSAAAAPSRPAQTDVERVLAAIWADILGRDGIGIDDDFFELGGDSILGLRAIGRANRAGLSLKPVQLMRSPTIAGLAAAIETHAPDVGGSVPLTPVQRRFVGPEANIPRPNSDGRVISCAEPLLQDLLNRSVQLVVDHHDALRARFPPAEGGWMQEILPVGARWAHPIHWVDLTGVDESGREAAVAAWSAELGRRLDPCNGSLMELAYLDGGAARGSHLLWIIHPVVVDASSWPILVEDLFTAYRQLLGGVPVRLPFPAMPFEAWARGLAGRPGRTTAPRGSSPLGKRVSPSLRLPPGGTAGPDEAGCGPVHVALTEHETEELIVRTLPALDLALREAVLSSLARVCALWLGEGWLPIDLEEDGRGTAGDGAALARTVGQFTMVRPVLLHLGRGPDGKERPCRVRDLHAHHDPAEICLGHLAPVRPGEGVGRECERIGDGDAASDVRRYALRIDGGVDKGRLRLRWRPSPGRHAPGTIERLAEDVIRGLRELPFWCDPPSDEQLNTTRFSSARLSTDELIRVAKLMERTRRH